MTLIKAYNLMENKKVIFWLNVVSIPLIFLFIFLFTTLLYVFYGNEDFGISMNFDLMGFVLFLVFFFLLIVVHELIHGAFFKLFHPEGKVKFGFKNGMAYATSPNSFYTRGQFILICLAPFVLISSALMGYALFSLNTSVPLIFLASCHAASCVGDFYWVYLISKQGGNIRVQDTEVGMSIYLKD